MELYFYDEEKLISEIKKAIEMKNYYYAENLLLFGSYKFPNKLDKYGDPFFLKELIRLLLSQKRYEEALQFIPVERGDEKNRGWYHILFARYLDSEGLREEALYHWKKFAETRPYHIEAHDAIRGKKASEMPSPFSIILTKIPNYQFQVIFDVGANVGQSCIKYAKEFPNAKIYAFEPVSKSFIKLKENCKEFSNIITFQIAFSSKRGKVKMMVDGCSVMNRVVNKEINSCIEVDTMTIEEFCLENSINHINFLKVDTEGHDLEVIKGCGDFIKNIDFIQCEASANKYNRFHCSFVEIFNFLSDANFYLFYIDEQTFEWSGGGYPVLRRFNMIFINGCIVGELKGVIRE